MTQQITIPLATLEQLMEALEATVPLMDKVWNYDGDVFGKLHNDAVDPKIKAAAEAAAEREHRSITSLIEVLILNHCQSIGINPAQNGKEQHK